MSVPRPPGKEDFSEDFSGDDDSMHISGTDIPKSTLAIGAVLWSILFAMQAWHLITTLNMREKQLEQSGDIRVMSVQQTNVSDDIKDLKEIVAAHERRLNAIERRGSAP